MIEHKVINSTKLEIHQVPLPDASITKLIEFAISFDWKEEMAANDQIDITIFDVNATSDLKHLRAALYSEQRVWNHVSRSMPPEVMDRFREVVALIRIALERHQ